MEKNAIHYNFKELSIEQTMNDGQPKSQEGEENEGKVNLCPCFALSRDYAFSEESYED